MWLEEKNPHMCWQVPFFNLWPQTLRKPLELSRKPVVFSLMNSPSPFNTFSFFIKPSTLPTSPHSWQRSWLHVSLTTWKQSEGSHLIFLPPHPCRAQLLVGCAPLFGGAVPASLWGPFLHLCTGFPAHLLWLLQLFFLLLPVIVFSSLLDHFCQHINVPKCLPSPLSFS